MDEALKLWFFQILHNFTLKAFAFRVLQTCTHMHILAATAAGREKKCICPYPRGSASMCVYFLYCFSMLWSEKGNKLPCFWMSQENHARQQQEQPPPQGKASQELRVTTTEAGAVPSLTRDTAPRTQTGKAEQAWWQRSGSATVHNHQRGLRVTRQVWGLARRTNQKVRTSEGCGWAVEELQRNSRQNAKAQLKRCSWEERRNAGNKASHDSLQLWHGCFQSHLIQSRSCTTAELALGTGSHRTCVCRALAQSAVPHYHEIP